MMVTKDESRLPAVNGSAWQVGRSGKLSPLCSTDMEAAMTAAAQQINTMYKIKREC